MIKMGQALAYDTKLFLPMFGIFVFALTAACTFGASALGNTDPSAETKDLPVDFH